MHNVDTAKENKRFPIFERYMAQRACRKRKKWGSVHNLSDLSPIFNFVQKFIKIKAIIFVGSV